MSESDASIGQAQQALRQLMDVNGRGDLIDRLSAFFPAGSGHGWLTSPGDPGFSGAFGTQEGDGGWLDGRQYVEFWGYVHEYVEGQSLDQLAGFLERVLVGWETAAQQQPPAVADAQDGPRYAEIGQVPGCPGWWQGYDTHDRDWRYVWSGAVPTDATEGWVVYSAAFPETEHSPVAGAAEAEKPPFDPQAVSHAVLARVMSELTEPDENGEGPLEVSEQERTELWNEVWAEVGKAAADWGPHQEDRITDTVVREFLWRLQQDDGSAEELLAEIKSFLDLLAKGKAG